MFQTNKFFYLSLILLTSSFCSISNSISTSVESSVTSVSKITSSVVNSVSKSVESVSDFISSPFSDKQSFFYNQDVKSITALYYKSQKLETLEFKNQLQQIANQNGITDWQNSSLTYYSIGQGLKVAGAEADYIKANFENTLDKNIYQFLEKGYHSVRIL